MRWVIEYRGRPRILYSDTHLIKIRPNFLITYAILAGTAIFSSNVIASLPDAYAINLMPNNILTMQAIPIFPPDGAVLTSFPASIKVLVTRGGYPVEGALVQFWFGEYNAGVTYTDSSGFAYLTLLNPSTLNPGYYSWHAIATKTGFKGGTTASRYFVVSSGNNIGQPSSGTISTDKGQYFLEPGNRLSVKISGNVNGYYLGDAIILKVTSPDGKVTQLVARGTYLGAFQILYPLPNNSVAGVYTVTAFYKYNVFSTIAFNVIKPAS